MPVQVERYKSGLFLKRWNTRFANIKMYALLCAISNNSNGMFWYALTGILTSIQRRFSFDSETTGRLLMAADIAPLAVVLFISHFANRGNMARILAGLFSMAAVAVVMMTLPHYILKHNYSADGHSNVSELEHVCHLANDTGSAHQQSPETAIQSNKIAFGILYASLFVFGLLVSPAYTLQFSYLESNTKKTDTTFYIALAGIGWCTSPLLGLLLSAWATSLPVDLTDTYLKPTDPAWVGAWWVALLVIAVCVFAPSPFFCWFPRKLKHDTKLSQVAIEGFFRSMRRLITNPCYMILVIGYIFWAFSGWGFDSFLPKYYEVVFNMTAWQASITAGLIAGSAFIIGRLASGITTRYLKLSLRRGHIICVLFTLVVFIATSANLLFGCDNHDLIGRPNDGTDFIMNLSCADGCACSGLPYTPVCDSGVTYFSPCHAGCTNVNTTTEVTYLSCNCTITGKAVAGICDTECNMFIPYTVSMFIGFTALAFTSPLLIVFTMRCVDPADKTLAYGFSMFMLGLAGWVPAPTVYGAVIDTTCTVWEDLGDGVTGSCWEYDIVSLRYRLLGLTAACRFAQTTCFIIVYILGRNKFEFWEKRCSDDEDTTPDDVPKNGVQYVSSVA